jgi:hypothetical protein
MLIVRVRPVVPGTQPGRIQNLIARRMNLKGKVRFLHTISMGHRNISRKLKVQTLPRHGGTALEGHALTDLGESRLDRFFLQENSR